jgi:hypothetical protein
MGLGIGNNVGFSWFNYKIQGVSQGNAEIRLSHTYDADNFFNNDYFVGGRPSDC